MAILRKTAWRRTPMTISCTVFRGATRQRPCGVSGCPAAPWPDAGRAAWRGRDPCPPWNAQADGPVTAREPAQPGRMRTRGNQDQPCADETCGKPFSQAEDLGLPPAVTVGYRAASSDFAAV